MDELQTRVLHAVLIALFIAGMVWFKGNDDDDGPWSDGDIPVQ
jgi:hypothetical protein